MTPGSDTGVTRGRTAVALSLSTGRSRLTAVNWLTATREGMYTDFGSGYATRELSHGRKVKFLDHLTINPHGMDTTLVELVSITDF